MKKVLHLVLLSLFIMMIAGCAEDCAHESDYNLVGVTYDDFILKSGIKSTLNATACDTPSNPADCTASLSNASRFGVMQGFIVQCGSSKFELQQTIRTLYPQEGYKEDKYEQCSDYYVYDFFAATHRSPTPYTINSISVDANNKNLWNVKVNGVCYQWDVTNTQYNMQ